MTDIYAAIESIITINAVSLAAVCDVLGVCRSAFYAWQSAEPSLRERELDELTPAIVAIFLQHRRRNGSGGSGTLPRRQTESALGFGAHTHRRHS